MRLNYDHVPRILLCLADATEENEMLSLSTSNLQALAPFMSVGRKSLKTKSDVPAVTMVS
jgi:hypothetical protein